MTVDRAVTLAGVAALAGLLGLAAAWMAVRQSLRWSSARRDRPAPSSSPTADAAASAGLPAPVVVGLRFAFERGRSPSAVPTRSVLAGAALSVTLVVATLTFASGLRTLVSTRPCTAGIWGLRYHVSCTRRPPARG